MNAEPNGETKLPRKFPRNSGELVHQGLGEFVASGLLVAIVFTSGTVRTQLGDKSPEGALVGSGVLGFGYGLVLWSFGSVSGAQTNPLVTFVSATLGGQRCVPSLLRVLGQFLGAAAMAAFVSQYLTYSFVRGDVYVALHPLAEAVPAFGFILVALGVGHRRDVTVPVALGAYATASFWMTGRATVGNPLLSVAVLMVATPEQSDVWTVAKIAAASGAGAGLAVPLALFLFPQAKEAASVLLFRPKHHS